MPKKIDKEKSLAVARQKGKLKDFICEHERDDPGDMDKLEEAIRRPQGQGTASKARKASRKASSCD